MVGAGGVGVIFGVGPVGDNKDLDIFIQAAAGPETVPLVAVYLVEGFTELNTPSFEFNMDKREAIYQYAYVISGVVVAAFFHILVYDLDEVVVDIVLVQKVYVLALAAVPAEDLDIVFLDLFLPPVSCSLMWLARVVLE